MSEALLVAWVADLQAENARLRAALAIYANSENWAAPGYVWVGPSRDEPGCRIAQAALQPAAETGGGNG